MDANFGHDTAPGLQVITIGADGALSGLQVKPGAGLDLREFGRADIQRASEVTFSPDHQKWFVEFRHAGVLAGLPLTVSLLHYARGGTVEADPGGAEGRATVYFQEYADAVQGEIDALNYVRLNRPEALGEQKAG